MNEANNFSRINVAGILFDENKNFLICQRSYSKSFLPGSWHLPGGKVEEDESLLQAISREFLEELNLTVVLTTPLQSEFIYDDDQDELKQVKTIFMLVEVTGEITLNEENQKYLFINLEDLPNFISDRSLLPSQSAIIEALMLA
jgi:8-oxo-dGTP diphosphatase